VIRINLTIRSVTVALLVRFVLCPLIRLGVETLEWSFLLVFLGQLGAYVETKMVEMVGDLVLFTATMVTGWLAVLVLKVTTGEVVIKSLNLTRIIEDLAKLVGFGFLVFFLLFVTIRDLLEIMDVNVLQLLYQLR